jgi:hypothetical protein
VSEQNDFLLPDDMAALKRFYECCCDFEAGGHDVPKDAMKRLTELGAVRSIGFGRHQTTAFGDYLLGELALPLDVTQPPADSQHKG